MREIFESDLKSYISKLNITIGDNGKTKMGARRM